jgi:hypothetical protein
MRGERITSEAGTNDSVHPSDAEKDRYIEIWKKAVETQMHFNEMSGKSRQLGLTFVAASLGVAVVLIARGDDFALTVWTWKVHVAVLLMLAGWIALWGVRGLDLNVYHRMLRGAVTFGEDFERNYMSSIFQLEKGMTGAISHYSRHSDADVCKSSPKYTYKGDNSVTAEKKIRAFYNVTSAFLISAALALFLINNFAQPLAEGARKSETAELSIGDDQSDGPKTASSAKAAQDGKMPPNHEQQGIE